MLWIPIALFFWWLIYREIRRPALIHKPYMIILLFLAIFFTWLPLKSWYFERFLTSIAQQLAENNYAKVHCNTLFDTLFDEDIGVAGHANPKTGYIVIQYPRCSILRAYIAHPERAGKEEIISLNVLTHESMHARGEYDEAKTECEAVQRNYRTAKLLGVPYYIAKKNALDYYQLYYMKRKGRYFSSECAPGKALDEHLKDSTWTD
ncbi:hypothetical protein [Legionella shakespearei]|uniref:Transmembrane protein n=1 Tax=Legionella shakespearei DSM 23087 TaxID=1122169 RepID=A0A0W0YW71_9GAMM|nr:hypothetical protein [Legionella shakespearei]KTD60758.1 hypothetical protein Lsha_1475 [Legionella shakespearei DSM 23087]